MDDATSGSEKENDILTASQEIYEQLGLDFRKKKKKRHGARKKKSKGHEAIKNNEELGMRLRGEKIKGGDSCLESGQIKKRRREATEIPTESIMESGTKLRQGCGVNDISEEPDVDSGKKKRKGRGATTMNDIMKIRRPEDRLVVQYNCYGQRYGDNSIHLSSYIGFLVHSHIPIRYASWLKVPNELKEKIMDMVEVAFVIDVRSKKALFKTAGTAFRQFKNILTTYHILPFEDQPSYLENPPEIYSHIAIKDWREFVKYRLSEEFKKLRKVQQARRSMNIYDHCLSRRGYANLLEDLISKAIILDNSQREILWKLARRNKHGKYSEKTQKIIDRIDDIVKNNKDVKRRTTEDVLCTALRTKESSGRVRGVGAFVSPTNYFHTPTPLIEQKKAEDDNADEEKEKLYQEIKELKDQLLHFTKNKDHLRHSQGTPSSEHASCNKKDSHGVDKEVEVIHIGVDKKVTTTKEIKRINVSKKEKKTIISRVNERNIIADQSKLPIPLRFILRHAEHSMVAMDSISLKLPIERFGVDRRYYVLREDIFHVCTMEDVATSVIIAYIESLHYKYGDRLSQYVFVDPGTISVRSNLQEARIRSLFIRLSVATPGQLVIAPYNAGGHWILAVINPHENIVYLLNSLRTGSIDEIHMIVNTALTMFKAHNPSEASRKNITTWKNVKCPLQDGNFECGYFVMRFMRDIVSTQSTLISDVIDTRVAYSQHAIDEVRIEWAEFLAQYI